MASAAAIPTEQNAHYVKGDTNPPQATAPDVDPVDASRNEKKRRLRYGADAEPENPSGRPTTKRVRNSAPKEYKSTYKLLDGSTKLMHVITPDGKSELGFTRKSFEALFSAKGGVDGWSLEANRELKSLFVQYHQSYVSMDANFTRTNSGSTLLS